ncbi:MAG: DMT family transporter [Bacteroidales bacterium]|nr:DMT family transporter [Bacteroidales bacterium]
MNDKSYRGHIAVLSANVIFGLFSPISKSVLSDGLLTSYSLTMLRMFGAAVVFWIASLFTQKEHVRHEDMALLFFASLFGIVFNQGFFLMGLSMTSPIDASIVATMSPILTMIIAAFYLKEPVTGKKVIGIFVGAVGALLLIISSQHVSSGNESGILGDIFCLLAEVSIAIYLTVFKKLIDRYSAITLMKWMFMYACIVCVPFCYGDVAAIDFSAFDLNVSLEILFVVFGATFLAYLFIPIGQKYLRPTIVSMYTYVQPLVASFIAVILGLDTLGWTKVISVILVFLGVYIVTLSKSKAQMEKWEEQQKKGGELL